MTAILRSARVAALCLLSGTAAHAQADVVRFHVEFTEVRESGPMRLPVRRVADIELRGGNRIVAVEDAGNRRSRRRQSDSAFGESYQMFQGRGRQGEWRVDTKDTLVRRSRGRTDTEILVLKTLPGGQGCEVGVGYVLLPGQTGYFRHSGWYDKVHAENISCRIVP